MILLDTHVLLWASAGSARLGPRTRERLEAARTAGEAAVSAVTFWEIAMLIRKRRLVLQFDLAAWRGRQLEEGLVEIPVDGEIAMRAGLLADMHGDPVDRLIIATAMAGRQLVTADRAILDWPGALDRSDARE